MYFDFKSSSEVHLLPVNTKIVLLAFETGTNLTKYSNLSVKQTVVSSLIFTLSLLVAPLSSEDDLHKRFRT